MAITIIKIGDHDYPGNLKDVYSPPKTLHVNGKMIESDETAVALVGSRRASLYGTQLCEKLAFDLAKRGITVVSGMAIGIDTAAHRGALKAGGRTIAVLGSGHSNIYPPQNKGLYEEICKAGAVVSEYEDGEAPLRYHFPQRNRIISGLSLGVVVVEAARNSGALITADFALEQGREVFAVPGKISGSVGSGTNALIKDGAKLVETADDIIEELSGFEIKPHCGEVKLGKEETMLKKAKDYILNSLTDIEKRIYKLLSDDPIYIDEIFNRSDLDTAKGSKALVGLELKSLVKRLPGKMYIRK